MPYGGYGGGGFGYAIDRVFAIGLLHHARLRARKHMLRKRKRAQRAKLKAAKKQQAILRRRILPLKLKATRSTRAERPAVEVPIVAPPAPPVDVPVRRPAPPQRVYQYTPAPPRDLHAGYHAARGGAPAPANPARATLRILNMQPGGRIEECYTPPSDYRRPPTPAPYVPQSVPTVASAVSQTPAPSAPVPVAAPASPLGDGARFPDRSVSAALNAPAVAPAAPVTAYKGNLGQLVLALTSNGWKKDAALRKVNNALPKLTTDDDEAMAIIKCIQAPE